MGEDHPIIWCHEKFSGKAWYTGLGHLAEAYEDEFFMNHLILGIRWAIDV
jgi:type 1 glutamine amidotransferase